MGADNTMTLTVTLVGFSKAAILVAAPGHGQGVWLPDRLISHDEDVRIGDQVAVTMPRWLANERGLK